MVHSIEYGAPATPVTGSIRPGEGEHSGDDAATCNVCGRVISGNEDGFYHGDYDVPPDKPCTRDQCGHGCGLEGGNDMFIKSVSVNGIDGEAPCDCEHHVTEWPWPD